MKCISHDRYLKVVYNKSGDRFVACAACGKKSRRITLELKEIKGGFVEFVFKEIVK